VDIEKAIIRTESEYQKAFTNYIVQDYGILFYNMDNKFSYDSNHAILYPDKIHRLDEVLEEIKAFYLQRDIVPRIYHPFVNGFLEQNKNILTEHGYDVEVADSCQYMLLTDANQINPPKQLDIREINEWDERVATQIFTPDDKEYTIDVIKSSLKNPNFHLYIGFKNDTAVCCASLQYSDYGCVRLDHVETTIQFRNNGYARELISHVVDDHRSNREERFYLWVENPIARKIYIEAGFTLMPKQFETWTAVYGGAQTESV
jgi:hypothetical protein